MSSTEDRVRRIVCEQLGVGEEEVTLSASFIDDLGADSLDTVELVMAFEEEFEIEIPDEEAEKIATVEDASKLHRLCRINFFHYVFQKTSCRNWSWHCFSFRK